MLTYLNMGVPREASCRVAQQTLPVAHAIETPTRNHKAALLFLTTEVTKGAERYKKWQQLSRGQRVLFAVRDR
jgi:hypothetical protein